MNWDAMSPRERDALIAEAIMGWTVNRSERGWHTVDAFPKRLIGPSKCRLPGDTWRPWEDVAAAWEVVEKMHEGPWDVCIQLVTPGVVVEFYHYESPLDDKEGAGVSLDPREGGICEAICLAALRAKGVKV